MVTPGDPQAAPGDLEQVRALLNTWRIANDTRAEVDDLADRPGPLRDLRDDLRAVVEGASEPDRTLTDWIVRLDLRAHVVDGRVAFRHAAGDAGDILSAVLAAIVTGTWTRLKTCPDCHWAFYDHTRNGSKRWCMMAPSGPGSRGCGNIAKVRRHRARARAERPALGSRDQPA
jgi:predicted RNA-binding Zn ribbon-like protein